MKTVVNGLELDYIASEGGATIRRVWAHTEKVVVPESVDDLPVLALGPRAFAPHPEEDAPDHRRIREITLPPSLERVGDYAFYNCFALEQIRLTDRTRYWGGSCLMNCRSLRQAEIRRIDGNSDAAFYFADELMTELDLIFTGEEGVELRLVFPEYTESYETLKPANQIGFCIYGGGFPYHRAFTGKRLDVPLFDSLWEDFLRREHEPECALRLAFFRLYYPQSLSARAAEKYRGYLAQRGGDVLRWLLSQRRSRGLDWFLREFTPEHGALQEALELARQLRLAESAALLLARLHREAPGGRRKTFDL